MPLRKLWKKIISPKKAKAKKLIGKTKKKATKKTTRKAAKKKNLKKITKSSKKPAASKPTKKLKKEEIGMVTHYFGKISVGIIKLKKPLKLGDKIQLKGAHVDFSQLIKSMQHNHKDIVSAKGGLEVGIEVTKPVHENVKVYKK